MNATSIYWIVYLTVAAAILGLGIWGGSRTLHMIGKYELKRSGVFEDEKVEISFQRYRKWSNRLAVTGVVMLMGGLFYALGVWSVLITGWLVALGLYVRCKYYRD